MSQDGTDLRELIDTLRRQSRLIFLAVGLTLVLALVFLGTATPLYTARALLMIDPGQRDLLEAPSGAAINPAAASARIDSEVEILGSEAIALRVVEAERLVSDPEFGPGLGRTDRLRALIGVAPAAAPDPARLLRDTVDGFRAATEVRRRGLTYLIEIAVSSTRPEAAARLANALGEVYIEAELDSEIAASQRARDVLVRQIASSRSQLSQREAALDAFLLDVAEETGGAALAGERRALGRISAERDTLAERSGLLRGSLAREDWRALVDGLETEVLAELDRQRDATRERLVAAQEPEAVPRLQEELAEIEARMAREASREIAGIEAEVAALDREEEDRREGLRAALSDVPMAPDTMTRLYGLQQDAALARQQYQRLLARLNEVETSAGVLIPDSRIVSPAMVPSAATWPQPKLVLALALIAGLGAGIVLALTRDKLIGGFTSAEQLEAATQARVAGVVPAAHDPAGRSAADAVTRAPLSTFAEALRGLKVSIDQSLGAVQPEDGERGRVILVTSSVPAEGKSTTALALARTYAATGASVLLIDGDLRKPALHLQSGTQPTLGFIDYLLRSGAHQTLKPFCAADPLSDVTLMLGRANRDLPTDGLIASPAFAQVLDGARETFDVTIIDSPPLLPVVDGRHIAPLADVTVLLVRWAATSQGDVRAALRLLSDSLPTGRAPLLLLSRQKARQDAAYGYAYREARA